MQHSSKIVDCLVIVSFSPGLRFVGSEDVVGLDQLELSLALLKHIDAGQPARGRHQCLFHRCGVNHGSMVKHRTEEQGEGRGMRVCCQSRGFWHRTEVSGLILVCFTFT